MTRACPSCDGPSRRLWFRQKFSAVDQATIVTGYDVVQCEECGLAYADGVPAQDDFDRYYREMSKYEYAQRGGEESDYDRRRLSLIADVVAKHVASKAARIVDVGCASGRLLAELRLRGYERILGLDPSPTCAATAARLYGVEVRNLTVADLAHQGDTFDVVLLVGVLEHLRDLTSTLTQLRASLPTDGMVYIEVPDVTAFADWDNAPYQDFSIEHINFFSPSSLNTLMQRHGFGATSIEQNAREQSYKTVMSNISAVFRKLDERLTAEMTFDESTAPGLERYLRQSEGVDAVLQSRISSIVQSRQPVIVWGVGTHTARLMATSPLSSANIVAFIDSNSRYTGKAMHGTPILPPEALKSHHEPVLISSRVFQKEIADQIRQGLGCSNELITLYHD